MRATSVVITFFLLLTLSAASGEKVRFSLHQGVSWVEAPAGWTVEEAEGENTAILKGPKYEFSFLSCFAPNPTIAEDKISEYAHNMVAVTIKQFEGGKIIKEEEDELGGHKGITVRFALGDGLQGRVRVFYAEGHAVLFMIFTAPGESAPFTRDCLALMETYTLNTDELEKNAATLKALGEKLAWQLDDYLSR